MKFFLRLFLILIFLSCSKKESQDLKELIYNVKFDVSGNGTIDKDSGSYNLTNSCFNLHRFSNIFSTNDRI